MHSIYEKQEIRPTLEKSSQECLAALGYIGDALKSMPIFEKSPSLLDRIVKDLVIESHKKGTTIISETQTASQIFFIIRGECFVTRTISLKTKLNERGEEVGLEEFSEPLLGAIRKDFSLDLIEIESGAIVPCFGAGTSEERIEVKRNGVDKVPKTNLLEACKKKLNYPYNVTAKTQIVTTGSMSMIKFLHAAANEDLFNLLLFPAVRLDPLRELQDSFIKSFEFKYDRINRKSDLRVWRDD